MNPGLIPKKRAVSSRFTTGKEYVTQARQELENKSLKPPNIEINL